MVYFPFRPIINQEPDKLLLSRGSDAGQTASHPLTDSQWLCPRQVNSTLDLEALVSEQFRSSWTRMRGCKYINFIVLLCHLISRRHRIVTVSCTS